MLSQVEISNIKATTVVAMNTFFEVNSKEFYQVTNHYKSNLERGNSFEFEAMHQILPLANFVSERAETVMRLMNDGRVWDAEIILRSMLEVLAKIYYIALSDDEQTVRQRLKEYWEILDLFERKKFSDKAKEFMAESTVLKSVFAGMILTAEEEHALIANPDYKNREYRKQLLASWSFTEIVKSISGKLKGVSTIPMIEFNYFYKMASHLAHGDHIGVSIIEERNSRESVHYSLSELLHITKIGRTTNEIMAELINIIHFFFRDDIALYRWQKIFRSHIIPVKKQHIILQKEAAKMGGYYLPGDDVIS